MFACDWRNLAANGAVHHYWKDVQCAAMPHLAHMLVAAVMLVIFVVATLLMVSLGRGIGLSV